MNDVSRSDEVIDAPLDIEVSGDTVVLAIAGAGSTSLSMTRRAAAESARRLLRAAEGMEQGALDDGYSQPHDWGRAADAERSAAD